MQNIKRILWVEDHPDNVAGKFFLEDETNIVRSLEMALQEISGSNLYMYDTIVLDIDFRGGKNNIDNVITEFRKKLYISKDQSREEFVIHNGGYLLFLYLLESGYPSNQIAFLTGNSDIISQLKKYNRQCQSEEMSKDDIADAFIHSWKESGDDFDKFKREIYKLPIGTEYVIPRFFQNCVDKLEHSDWEGVRSLIKDCVPKRMFDPLEDTGDQMIFKFHDANLEAPIYFSKGTDDIDGHNLKDAVEWLTNMRTDDRIARWLILWAGDFIENFFCENEQAAIKNVQDILIVKDPDEDKGDRGVRTAFRQMYFVFDGLRSVEHKGVYYQAIAGMLTPLEASVENEGRFIDAEYDELNVRRMFGWCLKQTRNLCAHNEFGTKLHNESMVFLVMISVLAFMKHDQWGKMEMWFQYAANLVKEKFPELISEKFNNREKIENLIQWLLANDKIDTSKVHSRSNYKKYSARDYLFALGYNNDMSKDHESNPEKRERYFMFTIAAYILKWFEYTPLQKIAEKCGQQVSCVYETAQKIVETYEYPT